MTGVLPLLKPPGITSQAAASRVKRFLGANKIGHAGTLDPDAAGVLPLLLGRATKLSEYLVRAPKEYLAELTIGTATDSLDAAGRTISSSPVRFSTNELIEKLPLFIGSIRQRPPSFSAVKLNGRPLYKSARAGRLVAAPERTVEVTAIHFIAARDNRFLLRVTCGSGTYVRSLLSDLAESLGTVGHTSFLLRTRAAYLSIGNCWTFAEIESHHHEIIAPEEAVPFAKLFLPSHLYPIVDSGTPVDVSRVKGLAVNPGCDYLLYCRDTFFGIARLGPAGLRLVTRIKI